MTAPQFLRIKKLTGKHILEHAARHNLREILAELGASQNSHIDPTKVKLNLVLRGHNSASSVASHAKLLMTNAGVKPLKKTAVLALEIIFGLPPDSTTDQMAFFNDSVQWAEEFFTIPIVSAVVHNDESAPHCHVLMLPLVDGRMIGSDLMGGPARLKAMQADFQARVGQRHGLARQTSVRPASGAIRKLATNLAFNTLQANSGLNDTVLRVLLGPHLKNPEPLLSALGLVMPSAAPQPETFVEIMTRPCKPESL